MAPETDDDDGGDDDDDDDDAEVGAVSSSAWLVCQPCTCVQRFSINARYSLKTVPRCSFICEHLLMVTTANAWAGHKGTRYRRRLF